MTETIWSRLMKLSRLMLNNIRIISPNLNEDFIFVGFIADFTHVQYNALPETRHMTVRLVLSPVLCLYGLNEL